MIKSKLNVCVETQKKIPDYEINECIKQHYNTLLYKYLKIITTIKIIQKNYYFFKMKYYVTKYITKYMQCQRNKYLTYNMYNKTQVIKLFDTPWKKIIMDFIIKLLKSKDLIAKVFYDLIIIVIDKLTKYFNLISFKETFNAKQLKYFFID